jgi:multiple sugar transport system permease protein
LILQLIGTLQIFTEPYLLTQGGPANSTMTVMLLIFRYAFGAGGGGDYGAAAALSLMLAGCLAAFTAVYFRATRAWSTQ